MQNTFFQQPGELPDETSFDSLPTAAPLIPICFVRSVSPVRTPSACVNYSAWKGAGRAEQPFEACADCRAWNGSPF